jgi:hypothetical protein
MAFWDDFKNALEVGTKNILKNVKGAVATAQPVLKPIGAFGSLLGRGAMAPFQALGIAPGATQGGTALKQRLQLVQERTSIHFLRMEWLTTRLR